MNIVWIVGNALAINGTLVCMVTIAKLRSAVPKSGLPVWSMLIIAATATVTALQFVYPEVLVMARRNPEALFTGEYWRMVTPLFVQPHGLVQCLCNAFFMLAFMPLAEKLYGKGLLALYFIPGIAGQAINYSWDPHGGGSSTAAFGVMGGLLAYVLRNTRRTPLLLVPVAVISLGAAAMLGWFHDGHGPAMLVGAAIGLLLPARELRGGVSASSYHDTSSC
ncbi:MAG: rhomboid family intramembrane serine protease [Sphingomonas bacterium]